MAKFYQLKENCVYLAKENPKTYLFELGEWKDPNNQVMGTWKHKEFKSFPKRVVGTFETFACDRPALGGFVIADFIERNNLQRWIK